MQKIHISTCPVCGSKSIKTFLHGKDFFVSQELFAIEKCQSCSFLFTQDFPTEASIGSYYESVEYVSHSDSKKGIINSLYHKVRSFMLKKKAALVEKQSSAKGSLLDVGTGTGYFANEMKNRGWQVSAIEKNAQAREFIHKNWQIDAKSDEALATFAEHSFDVVTLWHVLEHLEQLNESMHKFHSILKENGTLILALPNADSYDAGHYKAFWAAYDLPRHLWHFTPDSIKLLARKHGFEIKTTKRMPFDVFYISLLSEKYRSKKLQTIRAIIFGGMGWCCSLFCKKKSSSLIYILKKSN